MLEAPGTAHTPALSKLEVRARRALAGALVVGAALVATHRGEFWPFSIYPMFSRAGRPFTRSVVRELAADEPLAGGAVRFGQRPGRPFALAPVAISQNDVASFVSGAGQHGGMNPETMAKLFGEHARTRRLVVYAAQGSWQGGRVEVAFRPVLELAGGVGRAVAAAH